MTKTLAADEPLARSSIDRLQPRTIDTGQLARLDADLAADIDQLNDQIIELIFADKGPGATETVRLHQLQLIHRSLGHLNLALVDRLTPTSEHLTQGESCSSLPAPRDATIER